ncbi:MAG: hypothetical protein U0573_14900 [Phycisphaerales bacterium]|nr:hypothetical protein [Planctomycetota bacterium]
MAKEAPNPIDRLMEEASQALLETEYFAVVKLSRRALERARKADDFERMARILLPLQEARRQIRQTACDAGPGALITARPRPQSLKPGLYLAQPPMIALEARDVREAADARSVPIMLLCREPMTRAGKWPIAAVTTGGLVDTITLRVQVDPPPGTIPTHDQPGAGPTRDNSTSVPDVRWFTSTSEALGDAAIARVKADMPASWRVDELMLYLDAIPDHEKLHQRLAEACRDAAREGPAPEPRRRALAENPYSF